MTLFKNAGSTEKLERERADNSSPSPRKSVSTKLMMDSVVILVPLALRAVKSESTFWDVTFVGLSTILVKWFNRQYCERVLSTDAHTFWDLRRSWPS